MDLAFEIVMAFVLLAVVLRAAWRGNPRPSFFVSLVAGVGAVLLTVKSDPHGEMFIAWGLTVAAGVVALVAKRPPKPPSFPG